MLEINSNPDRRDLNELYARDAAAAGIPLVIDSDAHRTGGFEVVRYGVATARRAWLTPSQIANTRGWEEMVAQRGRHQAS
jgi:DNA polymerase (family X)